MGNAQPPQRYGRKKNNQQQQRKNENGILNRQRYDRKGKHIEQQKYKKDSNRKMLHTKTELNNAAFWLNYKYSTFAHGCSGKI
jgi:hypothetical protein